MKTLNETIEWLNLEHDYNASPNDCEYLNSASFHLNALKVIQEKNMHAVRALKQIGDLANINEETRRIVRRVAESLQLNPR